MAHSRSLREFLENFLSPPRGLPGLPAVYYLRNQPEDRISADSSTGFPAASKSLEGGSIVRKLLTFCALAGMTLVGVPQVLQAADADGECPLQNASLSGTYVSHGTGTIVGVGPISAVGTVTYDGKRNSINTFTASVNGAIFRG